MDVKEAKKLSTPTGKIKSPLLGINDLLQASQAKEAQQSDIFQKTKAEDPFSIDELRMNWRKFAFKAKKDGMGTLYTAMTTRDPGVSEGHKISYTVENSVQLDFIESRKIELLDFLRTELNNGKLELEINVEATAKHGLFTSKEKYSDMAKRNPLLENLRNKFNLDLDL